MTGASDAGALRGAQDIYTGGNFGSATDGGTGRMLQKGTEILVVSKSATERDLTITLANGLTQVIPILPGGGAYVVKWSQGARTIALATTDSGVFWAFGPEGTFRFRGSVTTASALVLASGATITDNGTGGITFKGNGGNTITITSGGAFFVGAGNNFQIGANGGISVNGTIATGGVGTTFPVGDSPTPNAITIGGASASYAPTGTALSTVDGTHPTPPTSPLTAQPAGTYSLGGFNPTNFAGVTWYSVKVWLNVTANTLAGVTKIQAVSTDDGGNALTYQMSLTDTTTGINGGSVPAATTKPYTGTLALIPLTSNQSQGSPPNSSSTSILQVNLVAGGAGAFTTAFAMVIEKVG